MRGVVLADDGDAVETAVRRGDLCSRRWRRLAFWRTILPLPVTLDRFAVPCGSCSSA